MQERENSTTTANHPLRPLPHPLLRTRKSRNTNQVPIHGISNEKISRKSRTDNNRRLRDGPVDVICSLPVRLTKLCVTYVSFILSQYIYSL